MSSEQADTAEAVDIVETRKLWSLQVRQDKDTPWTDIGTHKADAEEVLRTYDYWVENREDFEVRMVHTVVVVKTVDVDSLRASFAEATKTA